MFIQSKIFRSTEVNTSVDIYQAGKFFVNKEGVFVDEDKYPIDFEEDAAQKLLQNPNNEQHYENAKDDTKIAKGTKMPETPDEGEIKVPAELSEEPIVVDKTPNEDAIHEAESPGKGEVVETDKTSEKLTGVNENAGLAEEDNKIEAMPTAQNTKPEIQNYMTRYNIPFDAEDTKPVLLGKIVEHYTAEEVAKTDKTSEEPTGQDNSNSGERTPAN